MSRSYDFDVEIFESFTYETVYGILEQGDRMGFIYYEGLRHAEIPTLEERAKMIVDMGSGEVRGIYVKYEDNFFHLGFWKENDSTLSIHLYVAGFSWIRKYYEEDDGYPIAIDSQRYCTMLLKLLEPFTLRDFTYEITY